MLYEIQFLLALLLTLVVETLGLFLLCKILKLKLKNLNILVTGLIASTLTLPYLWFILPLYLGGLSYAIVGEILVALVESVLIMFLLKVRYRIALLLSVVVNALSFLLGLVIF